MSKAIYILMYYLIANSCFAQKSQKNIALNFNLVCKGDSDVLNKILINSFGETYTITKLKYYVSHVKFVSKINGRDNSRIYLIDAAKDNRIKVSIPSEKITGISFQLGIDSLLNFSGAQSGALDPLNDMFWTWNNGYIVFKMEGTSTSSNADLKRIEYHIGGYKAKNKVTREVFLPINDMFFLKTKKLTLELDVDKYWEGINKLSIAVTPVITLPGEAAKNVADNFTNMFLLKIK